jgi:hypothetical protein
LQRRHPGDTHDRRAREHTCRLRPPACDRSVPAELWKILLTPIGVVCVCAGGVRGRAGSRVHARTPAGFDGGQGTRWLCG